MHAHLKKELMEDEKYHDLMSWLIWSLIALTLSLAKDPMIDLAKNKRNKFEKP